jgi:hypothetical protein
VFADKRLTDPAGAHDPRTRIWVLLYAQVVQANGATGRNVLVARAPAIPRLDAVNGKLVPPTTRDVIGVAQFDELEIEQKFDDLALSADAPLSVIAVELLPSDHLVQQTATIGDRQVYFTFDQPDLPAGAQQPGNFRLRERNAAGKRSAWSRARKYHQPSNPALFSADARRACVLMATTWVLCRKGISQSRLMRARSTGFAFRVMTISTISMLGPDSAGSAVIWD